LRGGGVDKVVAPTLAVRELRQPRAMAVSANERDKNAVG